MNAAPRENWGEANRRHLMAAVQAMFARRDGRAIDMPQPIDPPARLDSLAATFGLGPFEQEVLLLALAHELGLVPGERPTIGEAFGLAGGAVDPALCPQGPLRRWRLIEIEGNGGFTRQTIRLDERILHHLLGIDYLDTRLDGLIEPVAAGGALSPAEATKTVEHLAHLWQPVEAGWPVLNLLGPDRQARRAVAAALAAEKGLRLFTIARRDVPHAAYERLALARLLDRELALSGGAILIDGEGSDGEEHAVAFVDLLLGPTLIAAREPLAIDRQPRLRAELPAASIGERRLLWTGELRAPEPVTATEIGRLAEQFALDRAGIRAVVERAGDMNGSAAGGALFERLWEGARGEARRRLDDLAERIDARVDWDDLVLPPDRLQQLRDISVHVRRAHQVHRDWGFDRRGTRGLGVAALFAGPSGTGKTMAAEVLAHALKLDLYRIDLSQVISKYIGETEKNLRRIFDAAEAGGAILLFDEADALFGKRSDVKDSHDRYANVEISYLLQKMEAYRGLAILTSNLKGALDTAFMRRLRFVVDFPFPDVGLRAEIWRRVFPRETPLGLDDPARMARLAVAGGTIRTIAINAAFLAAEADEPVEAKHLIAAARREYAKLEKPITAAEFGG